MSTRRWDLLQRYGKIQVTLWPRCASRSYWHCGSLIGLRAYMAIQCQYDLEAQLGHIITFLLHPRKLFCLFVSFFCHCISWKVKPFPKKCFIWRANRNLTIPDHSSIRSAWHNINIRASHFVCLTETGEKPRTVPCSDVPFFILLAFRYFMAESSVTYIGKQGLLTFLNLLSHIEK